MRTLVCGGRDYSERLALYQALDTITFFHPITFLIHGAARGADTLSSHWAYLRNIKNVPCPANWHLHGLEAGPIRNRYMLTTYIPEHVIAFNGGKGTADMIRAARALDIPVTKVIVTRESCTNLSISFKPGIFNQK